jgi:hypothetical protein
LALGDAEAKLAPAKADDFRKQLTSCLILVAPTGMAQEDRNEWLRAAWGTLKDIPPDMLEAGCEVARQTCDHPSKIVPTIIRVSEPLWRKRKDDRSRVLAALAKMKDPEPEPEDRCTPEQAREIMERFGIKPDETDESRAASRAHRGPPRAPDRQWYLDNGVAPEDLPDSMKEQAR